MRQVILGAVLALLATQLLDTRASADQEDPERDIGCGPCSLYTLLKLTGLPRELDEVHGLLPDDSERGVSIAEIRRASAQCGLSLDVVRSRKRQRPSGPVIAYLRRGSNGHFVVVRPVGHRGRLVGILDPVMPPRVLDWPDLQASPIWTGITIEPRQTSLLKILSICGTIVFGLVCCAALIRSRRRLSSLQVKAVVAFTALASCSLPR